MNDSTEKRLRILIAEDRADSAESMALLLRLRGHMVTIARDGLAALEKTEAEEPDVLLLDIGLPGMDGYKVAERLKERQWRKRPLIVAVSAFAEDRERSEACGIDLHLTKPVDPGVLDGLLWRFYRAVCG